MHATRELPRERWADYLQEVTVELRNVPVTVEISQREGDRHPAIEAKRMALQALAYDRRDDVFEVAAAHGGPHLPTVMRHMVDHPKRIEVDSLDSPAAMIPNVISVVDQEGVQTVVRIAAEATISG